MSKFNYRDSGCLLWVVTLSISCGNQVDSGEANPAFETPDQAFEECCDEETGEYRNEVAACLQYREEKDLDAAQFCTSAGGAGGGGPGGLPPGEEAFSCDLDIQLSDGRSKTFVWSQNDFLGTDARFSANARHQRFNIAVDEPETPNWVARITLVGPPQMTNVWSLPNEEVPYVGTNEPVERFELVGGTVEMTRCAGAVGEIFEIYIDATLQDLFSPTTGTMRGFLRSRTYEVVGEGGQFVCPPI
ncbi:MAG: hypothetical protein AAFN41_04865 [Planctomycetota bacterium]